MTLEQFPREWRNDELCYVDAAREIALALPGWAWWMIKVGQWLSREHDADRVVRIAISVPHRGYAAVLVAVGVVVGRCKSRASRDVNEHIEYLEATPLNTPVKSREACANRASYRRLLGFENRQDGNRYVCLSEGYKRATSHCSFIEPLSLNCPSFTTRKICERPDFVAAATKLDPYEHGFRQVIECVLVGIKTDIGEELKLKLLVGNNVGFLQDLVRVDEYVQHPSDGYRCRLVSAVAEPTSFGDTTGPVIFDGASAVLRWRHAARNRPWLAVLDRTAASADPARDAIIADRAMSIEDLPLPLGETPAGIEALCYVEGIA